MAVGLASVFDAVAKPAYPGLINYLQPDGSEISISMRGDESAHAIYDAEGNMLALNTEGFLVKASAEYVKSKEAMMFNAAAERKVKARKARRAAMAQSLNEESGLRDKYIFSGTPLPSEGEPHALVLLVEFTNRHFSLRNPREYFDRMLNEEGFSDYNMLGSVRDYYIENSGGKFRPVFDVYGPVELLNKMEYYGDNDWRGNDMRPHSLVIDACRLLNDKIDFSNYDWNDDGYIDNVYIFYAGYGEADSNIASTIWPHSADLSDFGLQTIYKFDGKILERYGMSNEVFYARRRTDGVSTFIHEFSHVLGLPDIYATDYSGAYTPGTWSVLDMGTYNNDGLTPPNFSLFERMSLGWAKPEEFPASGDYELEELTECNTGYIIHTEDADEFFLLENRQQRGWDEFIPGHGMLVWHIDFDQRIWDDNTVNNNPYHQYVDLVEADAILGDINQDGDSFPGVSNVTELSINTIPALISWGSKPTGKALSQIAESDEGLITFHLEMEDSGIDNIPTTDNITDTILVKNGWIYNEGTETAQVYNLAGMKILELPAAASAAPGHGIYIIRSSGNVFKVTL